MLILSLFNTPATRMHLVQRFSYHGRRQESKAGATWEQRPGQGGAMEIGVWAKCRHYSVVYPCWGATGKEQQ